jgi:hypothetical protein
VVARLDRLGRDTRDVLNIVHEVEQKVAHVTVLDPHVSTRGADRPHAVYRPREVQGTAAKDEALQKWCQRVTATGRTWRYARVNQPDFDRARAWGLEELISR